MRALQGLSIVAALALSTIARAEKFSHSPTVKPNATLTERSRPPTRKDAASVARPDIDASKLLEVQGLLGSIRLAEAKLLHQIIDTTEDTDPDKPDAYFRLGELWAKQYRAQHLLAIDGELAAGHEPDAAKKATLAADARAKAKLAHEALLEAVKAYTAMTSNKAFANYPQMDVALFYFGFTLQTEGRIADARMIFDRLLKDYPSSKFVPEAHIAFADYYFEQGQLADAEDRYRKVLKFPKSSMYWYAQYMLGWVELDQKNAQGALETFFTVANGTAKDPKQATLHHAAIKDFVRAYAEVGKADKALPAFQRVDASGSYAMLEQLADFYVEQGKGDRAIFVLRELMHDKPTDAHVCGWQQNVAREMMTTGTKGDQIHEIEQLVKLYAALRDRKTLPAGEAAECHDSAAEMSGQLARAYHQEAVKTKDPALLEYSDRLYRAYLGAFQGAADYAETQYFHSELSWVRAENAHGNARVQTQLWEDAAAAFTATLATGKLDPQLTKVAADAAMQAWMRALAVDPRTHDKVAADESYAVIPTPRPLPEHEQKLLAAYDLYLASVKDPKDEELVDVKFQRAALLRRFAHLPEAIAGFEDILAHHRDHETAEFSAQLALDSYNLLHRYDDMMALVKRLEADKPFLAAHDNVATTLATLHRQYDRKHAEELMALGEKTHDPAAYLGCAEAYLAIYNASPLAADGDEVVYDAGICYEKGKSLSAAIGLFGRMQTQYPKSQLTAKALARLGNIYAAVAYYRDAATKLEDYAKNYAGEKDAYDALSDAVSFRKGIGDDALAIADTELFIAKFGKTHPAEAANAAWSLTAIYEKQADLDKLAHHLRGYIGQHGAAGGADKLVMAYSKLGDTLWRASCSVPTVDGSCAKVSREFTGVRIGAKKKGAARTKTTCGEDDKILVTVVPRDATRVKQAMEAFASAIGERDKRHGVTGGDERAALYYYAAAKVGLAERDFEAYMATPIPTNLNFDPREAAIAKKSIERFEAWLAQKSKLGGTVRVQYEAVIDLKDGSTAIAAAARLGQITQSFAGQLYRAEIPSNLREGPYAEDMSSAYCDALAERAEPIEASAIHAYETCVTQSTRLGWFSEWSRLCERELGQLDPVHWPTAIEKRRAPDAVSAIVDIEGPAKL